MAGTKTQRPFPMFPLPRVLNADCFGPSTRSRPLARDSPNSIGCQPRQADSRRTIGDPMSRSHAVDIPRWRTQCGSFIGRSAERQYKIPISFPRGVLAGDRKRRPPGYFVEASKLQDIDTLRSHSKVWMQPIWAELWKRFPKLRMRLGNGTYLAYSGLRVNAKLECTWIRLLAYASVPLCNGIVACWPSLAYTCFVSIMVRVTNSRGVDYQSHRCVMLSS